MCTVVLTVHTVWSLHMLCTVESVHMTDVGGAWYSH